MIKDAIANIAKCAAPETSQAVADATEIPSRIVHRILKLLFASDVPLRRLLEESVHYHSRSTLASGYSGRLPQTATIRLPVRSLEMAPVAVSRPLRVFRY
jgi:hypothetical protein